MDFLFFQNLYVITLCAIFPQAESMNLQVIFFLIELLVAFGNAFKHNLFSSFENCWCQAI